MTLPGLTTVSGDGLLGESTGPASAGWPSSPSFGGSPPPALPALPALPTLPATGGLRVGASELPPGALGVGFQIAPGEPAWLSQAAARFSATAVGLDGFGDHVSGTAGSLSPSWTGSAAASYQQLSDIIHAHFRAGAATSRVAAAALNRYSAQLDGFKKDGVTATREAERCLEEIKKQKGLLLTAQPAATAAQGALSAAQREGSLLRAAGAAGAPFVSVADQAASAAQGKLSGAQTDAQTASKALQHAEDELRMWQARGRRAWDDAQSAADRATGTLLGLTIAPPPLAGIAPIPPLMTTAPPGLLKGPLINPGGTGLKGITGFSASPLAGSVTVFNREQPKQLSPEEEAARAAQKAGLPHDEAAATRARQKEVHNEKVQSRTRNQQKRQNGQRQKPKKK